MSRLLLGLALALLLALAPAPAAVAAEPPASLPDIEDEVMCLQCGTALNVSTAPVADRQREFIRRRIDRGQTKEQIKQALVAEFGPAVLAVPEDDGFSIAAWLVPALLVAGGIAGVVLTARRWRGAGAAGGAPAPSLSADDERRLDAELAAFDR
jgi:cytochrome c-type biogenesis protein CcmH